MTRNLVLLIAFSLLVSINASAAGPGNVPGFMKETLPNFTDELARLNWNPPGSTNYHGVFRVEALAMPLSKMSSSEQRFMSSASTAEHSLISVGSMVSYMLRFYERYGRMPEDGFELCVFTNHLDQVTKAEWNYATKQHQLSILAVGMNPNTGKPFEHLTATAEQPFGIQIKKGAIEQIKMLRDTDGRGNPKLVSVPYQAWVVKITGETTERTLFDHKVWRELQP